jgi:predicted O-linked N-acetylglucosamine transferase (SPINDLY family)
MSRFSSSLLAYAGLPALATTTREEYVQKAIELAQDPDMLAHLRQSLRAHLSQTPLFNSKQFIEGLENAYTQIFEKWCTANAVKQMAEIAS